MSRSENFERDARAARLPPALGRAGLTRGVRSHRWLGKSAGGGARFGKTVHARASTNETAAFWKVRWVDRRNCCLLEVSLVQPTSRTDLDAENV